MLKSDAKTYVKNHKRGDNDNTSWKFFLVLTRPKHYNRGQAEAKRLRPMLRPCFQSRDRGRGHSFGLQTTLASGLNISPYIYGSQTGKPKPPASQLSLFYTLFLNRLLYVFYTNFFRFSVKKAMSLLYCAKAFMWKVIRFLFQKFDSFRPLG